MWKIKMKKTVSFLTLMTVAGLTSIPAMAAPNWTIDAASSHLNFNTKQGDKDIKGEFKTFTSTIVFDKADLPNSHFKVVIQTGSATTGDATSDGSLLTKDWLNVGSFPDATFESTKITAAPTEKSGFEYFEAAGKLTILGVSQDVTLPFSLKADGTNTIANGQLTLKRLDFGVGKSVDPNGEMVANDVTVTFSITAYPASQK